MYFLSPLVPSCCQSRGDTGSGSRELSVQRGAIQKEGESGSGSSGGGSVGGGGGELSRRVTIRDSRVEIRNRFAHSIGPRLIVALLLLLLLSNQPTNRACLVGWKESRSLLFSFLSKLASGFYEIVVVNNVLLGWCPILVTHFSPWLAILFPLPLTHPRS